MQGNDLMHTTSTTTSTNTFVVFTSYSETAMMSYGLFIETCAGRSIGAAEETSVCKADFGKQPVHFSLVGHQAVADQPMSTFVYKPQALQD